MAHHLPAQNVARFLIDNYSECLSNPVTEDDIRNLVEHYYRVGTTIRKHEDYNHIRKHPNMLRFSSIAETLEYQTYAIFKEVQRIQSKQT